MFVKQTDVEEFRAKFAAFIKEADETDDFSVHLDNSSNNVEGRYSVHIRGRNLPYRFFNRDALGTLQKIIDKAVPADADALTMIFQLQIDTDELDKFRDGYMMCGNRIEGMLKHIHQRWSGVRKKAITGDILYAAFGCEEYGGVGHEQEYAVITFREAKYATAFKMQFGSPGNTYTLEDVVNAY